MNFRINWEALGVAASVACAIHCAVMPLIITSLPLLAAGFFGSIMIEVLLLLLAFVIGFYSLWHGYRRHHHRPVTLLIFSGGMLFFLLHQFIKFPHSVIFFILPGIVMILSAHFLNHRYCRLAKHCHSTDCNH
jgi:hypothetical protein